MKQSLFFALVVVAAVFAASLSSLAVWTMLPAKVQLTEKTVPQTIIRNTIINEANASDAAIEMRLETSIEKIKPSVVHISSQSMSQTLLRKVTVEASGSGFILTGEGHIITNAHVIEGATEATVLTADGGVYNGTIVGSGDQTDLAVIKINSNENLVPAQLGDSDNLTIGQFVLAVGSPYQLSNTITFGIVSGLNRTYQSDTDSSKMKNIIQTDAAINPGNSGGPLLDLNGNVIGINTALISKSGGYEGISLAIPMNTAKEIADELIAKGRISRPWMGITLRGLSPQTARALGLANKTGILVLDVVAGSPADKAGLEGTLIKKDYTQVIPGDIITQIDGRRMATTDDLIDFIATRRPGENITLTLDRNNTAETVVLTLGEKPSQPITEDQFKQINP